MLWLVLLLELHGPNGQVLMLNPQEIVSLREPRNDEHFPKGIQCIVNTSDGKFAAVVEDCLTIERRVEDAE